VAFSRPDGMKATFSRTPAGTHESAPTMDNVFLLLGRQIIGGIMRGAVQG
jgi:hypothetical protein